MELKWSGDYLEVFQSEKYDFEFVKGSDSVLALPKVKDKYIIRKEVCPAYSVKGDSEKYWTMVSGSVEEGETDLQTLRREMGEETPVRPNRIKLFGKQKKFPFSKALTSRFSFYHFKVLDFDKTPADGDGSKVEEDSEYAFVSPSRLIEISDQPNSDITIMYSAEVVKSFDT